MLQPDWTVPTHTRRDSYWRQAVTTCVITFLNANGLLSTDKEVVSLVQKSTFSCMMTVKAPSPCHWRRRFQACGAARWRQGCWTAWRRAAQWNKVQTAGNGANQSMGKALRCTRCSFFRRPWPRRSFGARWLCPPPPFLYKTGRTHTAEAEWVYTQDRRGQQTGHRVTGLTLTDQRRGKIIQTRCESIKCQVIYAM